MSAAKWTPPTELIVSRELLLCGTTGQKVAEVNTEELESWKQCDRVAERLAESWNACREMEDPAAEIEKRGEAAHKLACLMLDLSNKGWDDPSAIPTASAVAAARAALEAAQRVIDGRDDFTPGPRSAAAHAIQEALAQLPPGGAS